MNFISSKDKFGILRSMFNPHFKDFLKKNPNISMLKLSWALYWRLQIILLPIIIIISIIMSIFTPKSGI